MGNCISGGAVEVSDEDRRRHKEAEKSLREVRIQHLNAFLRIYAYLPSSVLLSAKDSCRRGKS